MTHCEPLFWYGILVVLLVGAWAFVPWWRGKAELISGWNFLLAGVAIFVGIGAIEAAVSPMRFAAVSWFEPTKSIMQWWTVASTIFLISLLASHRYDPISRKAAAHCFNKWPPISTGLMLFVIFVCFFLALTCIMPPLLQIPVAGPIFKNVSHKAMIFCVTFAFALWYRNRINLLWLVMFVLIFLTIGFVAMLVSGGRRLVLCVFMGPVLVFYFYHARYWRPIKSIGATAVAIGLVFCVSLMYSTIRHFDRRGEFTAEDKNRSAALALDAVKNIDITGGGWIEHFANDMLWGLSQHVVHYGMLTDHYVRRGDMEAQPLNTFKFMAVYPIPRQVWPSKPFSLGHVITHEMLGRKTSWGTGVAGHSAYEGGLIVAALFGYFAAFGIRFFDDPLNRQPTNPFLIAMLAAASLHIIAWPRGDLAVMTFEVAECFFFTIALSWMCRFLIGTDKSWSMNRSAIPGVRAVYPRARALRETPVPSISQPTTPPQQSLPSQTGSDAARTLWAFGPLPPPVTGMTLTTSMIVEALQSAGTVRSYNWSPGMAQRSLSMRLRRNVRMMRSVLLLIARGRVRNDRLYLVANSASGLYTTAMIVFVAKRLGYTIYLHHHVYFYIDKYDRCMAWIVRQLGPRDVHIVHNAHMIGDFRNRYPTTTSGFQILYPSIIVGDVDIPRMAPQQPMRLGLLSNLSAAKGLREVVETFAKLAARNRNVTLTLAGPVVSHESQRLIDDAIAKYPGRLRSLGPVYGENKRRFFADIDVFLFPTKTEAWGVVVNESLAAGVPLVTYDRGCLAMVVGDEAGLLLERDESFPEPAALQIERWIDDHDAYRRASTAAIAQAARLRDDGQRTLDDFVRHMFSPLPATSESG